MPNAAVDFPFISPVCTISSGRLRRWRVVRPSSGTATGCPFGMSGSLPFGHRADEVARGNVSEVEVLRSQVRCELRGESEADAAVRLAVDHDGGDPAVCQPSGGLAGAGE